MKQVLMVLSVQWCWCCVSCLRVGECDLQDLLPDCHDPDRCHIHCGPQIHPDRVLGPVLLHHCGVPGWGHQAAAESADAGQVCVDLWHWPLSPLSHVWSDLLSDAGRPETWAAVGPQWSLTFSEVPRSCWSWACRRWCTPSRTTWPSWLWATWTLLSTRYYGHPYRFCHHVLAVILFQ